MIELAGCIIQDGDGKVLLLHRQTEKLNQWELPGGKVETGEDPATAAIREIKEELGVDVTIGDEVGNASFVEGGKEWSYHWFEAAITSGQTPYPAEPDKFDTLKYWHTSELNGRHDLSANLRNLISSGHLAE